MNERAPFFLAGVDRSGIGLLGELLEAHPHIAVTRRINFWSFYYQRYGDLKDPVNFDRCLADMLRYTRISRLQPHPDRLRADFQKSDGSYASLFALLQEQNMRRLGKTRWADKSLNAEGQAEIILQAFPTARMIHILRDPRDRYVSQRTHRGAKRGRAGGAAALWLWSARLAERNQRAFPGRYKIVRYEDLVAGPEAFLADVCDFVGESYSAEMLLADADDQGAREPRQIWTHSVGRFRESMSAGEIAFLQWVLARAMGSNGYQPEAQRLTLADRLKQIAVDYPLNLSLMALALAQFGLRDMKGRRPSERRLARRASPAKALEIGDVS